MNQLYNGSYIGLITNRFNWKWLDLFSLLLRVILNGPNHSVIFKDGLVYEMVGSGLKITELDKWLTLTKRSIKVYKPLVPVTLPEATKYGYLDLIQIGLHLLRKKLGVGKSWNGVDGTRLWKGTICSEYCALAIGREDAHIQTPTSLQYIKELSFEYEFTT
jgi:hypothetical protein